MKNISDAYLAVLQDFDRANREVEEGKKAVMLRQSVVALLKINDDLAVFASGLNQVTQGLQHGFEGLYEKNPQLACDLRMAFGNSFETLSSLQVQYSDVSDFCTNLLRMYRQMVLEQVGVDLNDQAAADRFLQASAEGLILKPNPNN